MTVDASSLLVDGPWQHRFVSANAARFHVAVAGPDDHDAPLVVLLHGVFQHWWEWRDQLPALGAAGYRVAAMDLRGACASDKPPQGYDVPTLAHDVAGVIRSLGARRAVVVGHGIGGGDVAWAMPAYHPDVTVAVAALSAPHPLQTGLLPGRDLRPTAWRRLLAAQVPGLPERAAMHADLVVHLLREWGGPGWPPPDVAEVYRRGAEVPFAAHSALEVVRWLVRSGVRPDGHRHAARLRSAPGVPTLQVHGALDGCRPALSAPLHGALARRPGLRLRYELLTGVGYALPEEAPALITDVLLSWLPEVTRDLA